MTLDPPVDPLTLGPCYFHFKGFNEHWRIDPKGRLAAMAASHSTRMGALLRHAARCLENHREEKRLLMLLTENEAYDIDVQDPKFLRDDTHMAVSQLAGRGITTYCISLDPHADGYVAEIFGRNKHTVIDRVERLPEKLPRLFMALTKVDR